jgi:hypothetical protein
VRRLKVLAAEHGSCFYGLDDLPTQLSTHAIGARSRRSFHDDAQEKTGVGAWAKCFDRSLAGEGPTKGQGFGTNRGTRTTIQDRHEDLAPSDGKLLSDKVSGSVP